MSSNISFRTCNDSGLVWRGDSFATDNKKIGKQLLVACEKGKVRAVSSLLQQGASIEYRGPCSQTPLMVAVVKRRRRVVEFLLQKGAKVNAEDTMHATALMKAVVAGSNAIVKMLLAAGAETDRQRHDGLTALMLAACHGKVKDVRRFLKAGAEVDIKSGEGNTAFLLACQNGYRDIVEILMEGGAHINEVAEDQTNALYKACLQGHDELVDFLLEREADTSLVSTSGYTPFLEAKMANGPEKYKKLKEIFHKYRDKSVQDGGMITFPHEYEKVVTKTKKASLFYEIEGTTSYTKLSGHKITFNREGAHEVYTAKIVAKHWRMWSLTGERLMGRDTIDLVTSHLALLTEVTDEKGAAPLVDQYFAKGSVFVTTGFDDHSMQVLLWKNYVIHINRGALYDVLAGEKTVRVFRISAEKMEDREFVVKYIEALLSMSAFPKDTCKEWLKTEFQKDYYLKKTEFMGELEKALQAPPQTAGNCTWASLEVALLSLIIVEVLEKKKAVPPGKKMKKELRIECCDIVKEEKAKFARFTEFLKKQIKLQYLKLPQQHQEEEILRVMN